MYRFLVTPRWLGLAALSLAMAAVMVLLGLWQLHRYHERSTFNARVAAASSQSPVALAQVLPAPTRGAGTAGATPPADKAWTLVTATGRYDPAHEILARGRTVDGQVGFEVVTPLRLASGVAVLVDRGWVPPAPGGAIAAPRVPPAPAGEVTVAGRVHLPESRPDRPLLQDGRIEVRRISPDRLAPELPYPVYGAYVLLDRQTPPADPTFVAIPPVHQNAALNAGYAVQWWIFAAMTLVGYGWLARREARGENDLDERTRQLIGGGTGLSDAPVSPAV